MKEFPNKKWNPRSIDRLICKLVQTGTTDRSKGSGRPRTASTEDNIAEVDEVIKSQEDQPGTHLSKRKISQNLGISLGSVHNIARKDLKLKEFKRISSSRKTPNVKQKRKHASESCWIGSLITMSNALFLQTRRIYHLKFR